MGGIWWLNVLRFRRFAIPIVDAETKKNNKDSTETKKTITDSDVIESFNDEEKKNLSHEVKN